MRRLLFPGAMVAAVLLAIEFPRGPGDAEADTPEAEAGAAEESDLLWANAACCVCHIPFAKEELGKVHLAAKIACFECHGLSADHANDEDIGATPPDVVFRRDRIDAACLKCHETHDAAGRDVVARFLQRRLSAESPAVCTDCHGSHRIERSEEDP